jgi:chitodextrinase
VPLGLTAIPGNNLITLSWASPDNNGGTPIDYYIIYQNGIDIFHTTLVSLNVTGLANEEPYNFTVAAHNSIGTGAQTASIMATPSSGAAVPGVPTGLTASAAGTGKVLLSWAAPSDGASIDYYIVYQNGVDVDHTSVTSDTITGLTNGENYTFSVAAHNPGGVGSRSSAQIISPSSSKVATIYSGDTMAFISIGLALLLAAIVGVILVVKRNRKKVQ